MTAWGQKAFAFFIAGRYFFSRKSTAAVNVIALISVLGIALVAMAMVIVLSVFNGFEAFTDTQLSALSPDYLIEREDGSVFDASEVPIPGAAPILKGEAVASTGASAQPLTILGVDTLYTSAVAVEPMIIEGEWDLGDGELPGAVIGIGAAANLGTGAGYVDPLTLTLPKRLGRISTVMPQRGFLSLELPVTGVFRVDQKEDESLVYLPIETVRELLQYDGEEVTALALPNRFESSPKEVQKSLPEGFVLKDKVAQYPEVYRVLNIEKWVSVLLLVFVLILSLFSVVSTLGMLIIEKREDTRVLSLLGARPGVLDDIIVLESWLLSLSGVTIGVVVGVVLVLLQDRFGWLKLGGGGSGGAFILDAYPVELRLPDLLLVIAVILAVGWLSSRLAYALFRRSKGAPTIK